MWTLEKAYDRVSRESLWEVLGMYSVWTQDHKLHSLEVHGLYSACTLHFKILLRGQVRLPTPPTTICKLNQ